MQHSNVVGGFLTPPDENTAEAIHPTMGPFHNPAPRFIASLAFDLLGFLTPRLDMGCETEFLEQLTHLIIVIPLIHTHAVRLLRGGLGAYDGNTLQRCFDQLHVVAVGAVDGQPHGNALPLDQQAAFDALLGAIGGVFARLFPPRGVPWSCTRPCSTNSSRCLSSSRIPATLPSTSGRRPRPQPTVGSGHGRWTRGKRPWHRALSTDSQCGARRKWHPYRHGREWAACRRQRDGCSRGAESAIGSPPTGHRGCA